MDHAITRLQRIHPFDGNISSRTPVPSYPDPISVTENVSPDLSAKIAGYGFTLVTSDPRLIVNADGHNAVIIVRGDYAGTGDEGDYHFLVTFEPPLPSSYVV